MKTDIKELVNAIRKSVQPKPCNTLYFSNSDGNFKNEFLFFIKPELTIDKQGIQLADILSMILEKISAHNLLVKNIRIINASYLEKHNIIAQHYGVINKLSSDIHKTITSDAIVKFEQIFSESYQKAEVLGSIELLAKYPHYTPTGLSWLWQNCPTVKLAGGTYAQKLLLDGKAVYLINGFHPRQLEHFIASDRCIVTMTLAGDIDWSLARNSFIGKTNPLEAEKGSLRRELFEKKDSFGLINISSSWNGVHLSAGPVEGLVELIRYNSDFESRELHSPETYDFGKKLISAFGAEFVENILKNPTIEVDNKESTIFDFTEEKNSDECLKILENIKIR
jgi:hypothetical protein